MPTSCEVVCYFHDPIKAPLLRTAVLPGLAQRPTAVRAHLERGWQHGPHLRVVLSGPQRAVDVAADELGRRLRDHLRDRPSTVALSGPELLRMSRAAGRAELVPPPYGPFAADNTVSIRPVGTPAGADAMRARLLSRGTAALGALLEQVGAAGDTSGARIRGAVVVLTAFAVATGGSLSAGRIGYESHLAVHRHAHDPDGTIRSRHRAVWRAHRTELRTLVADIADGGGGPTAQAWREWERTARGEAAASPEDAVVRQTLHDNLRAVAAFADPAVRRAFDPDDISPFHRTLDGWRPEGTQRTAFERYRFCVNVLYLLLAVADVTPAERLLAAGLVCDTITDLTGLDWRAELHRDGRAPFAADPVASR